MRMANSGVIAARQDLRARRAAKRRSVKAREANSLGRQLVDIGSFDVGRTIAAQVAVALIICEDDDDVRLVGQRGCAEANAT